MCGTKLSFTDHNIQEHSDLLLVICEFEVRIKLGDILAEKILDKILSSPQLDAKTLEIIAGELRSLSSMSLITGRNFYV